MNEVFETIYNRRSIRAYKNEQIPDDMIKEVLKAGFHAANGVNAQALRFTVVSDREKIKTYSDKGKKLYLEDMKAAGYENDHLRRKLEGDDNLFFNAPTVIFVFADKSGLTVVEDASLAIGNMMLAAKSLGMGTCWIGLAGSLSRDGDFVRETGSEGMRHLGSLIIGYPSKEPGPSVRGEVQILKWIK